MNHNNSTEISEGRKIQQERKAVRSVVEYFNDLSGWCTFSTLGGQQIIIETPSVLSSMYTLRELNRRLEDRNLDLAVKTVKWEKGNDGVHAVMIVFEQEIPVDDYLRE